MHTFAVKSNQDVAMYAQNGLTLVLLSKSFDYT